MGASIKVILPRKTMTAVLLRIAPLPASGLWLSLPMRIMPLGSAALLRLNLRNHLP